MPVRKLTCISQYCRYFLLISVWSVAVSSAVSDTLYLSTERPTLTLVNPKYYSFFNFTTARYGRRNPVYYVNVSFTSLFTLDNNMVVSFWFYEYYSSQYRRTFLEITLKWCNLVYTDSFFGPALRGCLPQACPHKPGTYHLQNMTASISGMPNLPFTKGRIYANFTVKHATVASGYIDVELKRRKKS